MSASKVVPPVARRSPAGPQSLTSLLQRIHDLISQHGALAREADECVQQLQRYCDRQFKNEEQSDLVQQVTEEAPWLADRIAELSGQHHSLRRHLIMMCRNLERHQLLPRCWEEFAEEVSHFEQQLARHESAELEFWMDVCNQDIGTKD